MNSDRIVAAQLTPAQYKAWVKKYTKLGITSSDLLRHFATLNQKLEEGGK